MKEDRVHSEGFYPPAEPHTKRMLSEHFAQNFYYNKDRTQAVPPKSFPQDFYKSK